MRHWKPRVPLSPLFIIDPMFEKSTFVGENRLAFLYANLSALDDDLKQRGGRLIVRRGDPTHVLRALLTESQASAIFAQEDISPFARKRDAKLVESLPLFLTGGLTVHPLNAVRKADGSAYTIYTPFRRAWRAQPFPGATNMSSAPERILVPPNIELQPIPREPRVGGWDTLSAR